jgi:hypothetical protein
MKKKSEKRLHLGKVTIANLSKKEQQLINGGIPTPTAPIICLPTRRLTCRCTIYTTYTTVIKAD